MVINSEQQRVIDELDRNILLCGVRWDGKNEYTGLSSGPYY